VNETPATPGEGPTAVQGASMAYDGATNQLILLDGGVSTEQVNQMWTWNGSIWAQLSGTMPPARDDASLAYDQATGQLVLFGGTDFSNDELSDTWVWGGTTPGWTSESPASSPSGRSDAVMADDPSSGNLLLFGGYNGSSSNLGDTWEWTGSNWVQPGPAASPLSRTAAMGASDPSTGQVVLYGGVHSSVLSDTWVWGYPDTWAQAGTASAPPARSDAAMAYDAGTDQLVLFGGQGSGGTALDDTWVWNGSVPGEHEPEPDAAGALGRGHGL
jgi:hypothetical protein